MKIIFLFALIFITTSSCFSQRSLDTILTKQKVVQIEDHENLYVLITVNPRSYTDTMKIISRKDDFFKKYRLKSGINHSNSKKIQAGDTYSFILRNNTRFNIDPQTHARYIIMEKDTLWREGDQENRVPYSSLNTKGLLIKED